MSRSMRGSLGDRASRTDTTDPKWVRGARRGAKRRGGHPERAADWVGKRRARLQGQRPHRAKRGRSARGDGDERTGGGASRRLGERRRREATPATADARGATKGSNSRQGKLGGGEERRRAEGERAGAEPAASSHNFFGAPRTRGIDGRSGRQAANAASGARRYGRRTADSRATATMTAPRKFARPTKGRPQRAFVTTRTA